MSDKKAWDSYLRSRQYLASGSSTNSKIPLFTGVEPASIVKGKGCRVWDADGNEYIDFRNGLGPVTLGYGVPEIDEAIKMQLQNGVVFGHPHPLEGEVAEMLVNVVPCAQRVRFLKTGGEAIAACIKIARNATNRDVILQCGYNGWLNSLSDEGFRPSGLINSNPTKGVPASLAALHHMMPWGKEDVWENVFRKIGDKIAAVVIACDYSNMSEGLHFLPAMRRLTQQYGALMIMDEIVTGFRLAIGGAHEYFNFMPDMAVFAKGISNGMPLSVYTGRAELLDSAEGLGISSTFGGETLSLAAAKVCIRYYQDNKVIENLWKTGKKIWPEVNALFGRYGIGAQVKGFEVCPLIEFASNSLAKLFFCACYKYGVSLYNVSYVNYAHKENDIAEALERMECAIKEMATSGNNP
ncbi:MAG: hypothetical protein A2Y13_05360 [Planctomycetes bacterium GWC2_45_44]|nr:MAG: hypothetical protein A2Y13_05360 [Planctomycetes bacterium GWC2_45_44]